MTASDLRSSSFFIIPFKLDSGKSETTTYAFPLNTTTGCVEDLVLNLKAESVVEYFRLIINTKKVDTTTHEHQFVCFDVQKLCKDGIERNKATFYPHREYQTFAFKCDGTFVETWLNYGVSFLHR